jgi:hypothetical protein
MKITLGRLRRLVREAARDTVMAPTEPVEASPEAVRTASHPSLRAPSPADAKVNQVSKLLQAKGHHANVQDLKKFVSGLDPKRALVLTPEDIASAFLKKTAN